MGFYTFDDPRFLEGRDLWWMSFPKIESRVRKGKPFDSPPRYRVGDSVRFKIKKRARVRKILKVEWHCHRYQWVYVVETSATDVSKSFQPYWFADKLEYADVEGADIED